MESSQESCRQKKLMHRPVQEDFENEKNEISHSWLKPIGNEK